MYRAPKNTGSDVPDQVRKAKGEIGENNRQEGQKSEKQGNPRPGYPAAKQPDNVRRQETGTFTAATHHKSFKNRRTLMNSCVSDRPGPTAIRRYLVIAQLNRFAW
jgi:hypothetical protein